MVKKYIPETKLKKSLKVKCFRQYNTKVRIGVSTNTISVVTLIVIVERSRIRNQIYCYAWGSATRANVVSGYHEDQAYSLSCSNKRAEYAEQPRVMPESRLEQVVPEGLMQ